MKYIAFLIINLLMVISLEAQEKNINDCLVSPKLEDEQFKSCVENISNEILPLQINAISYYDERFIFTAIAMYNSSEIIDFLVENGALLNVLNKEGRSIIQHLASNYEVELVEHVLKDYFINTDSKSHLLKYLPKITPENEAEKSKYKKLFEIADYKINDSNYAALMIALSQNNSSFLDLYDLNTVIIDQKDENNNNFIQRLILNKISQDHYNYFLKQDFDIKNVNNDGKTLLEMLFENDEYQQEYLVNYYQEILSNPKFRSELTNNIYYHILNLNIDPASKLSLVNQAKRHFTVNSKLQNGKFPLEMIYDDDLEYQLNTSSTRCEFQEWPRNVNCKMDLSYKDFYLRTVLSEAPNSTFTIEYINQDNSKRFIQVIFQHIEKTTGRYFNRKTTKTKVMIVKTDNNNDGSFETNIAYKEDKTSGINDQSRNASVKLDGKILSVSLGNESISFDTNDLKIKHFNEFKFTSDSRIWYGALYSVQ